MSFITKAFSFFNFNPWTFALQMVASAILSKLLAPSPPSQAAQQPEPNPGSRAQTPPAGNNKLPVIYGHAWLGGIITDLSITADNQTLYYVFALSEVTNTESGVSVGDPDTITFGDVYWGGKKCIFGSVTPVSAANLIKGIAYQITTVGTTDFTKLGATSNTVGLGFTATSGGAGTGTATPTDASAVSGLYDPSTSQTQDITGYMNIYFYKNGSNQPVNSGLTAIQVMSATDLTYKWDSSKLMSNTSFAIIKLKYSQSRNLVGLNATNFEITNARKAPGDCFLDYLTSTRYGASIPLASIDTTSLTALNSYSNAPVGYTTYTGGSSSQSRFQFNGQLDTAQKIMKNIQSMSDCCDCLVKYNEITGLWGVIVQTPIYTVVMDINNSNMIGPIVVSPIDISNSFNIIECKFPDSTQQDSFNAATFDLAELNPSLLFPNEPVNKQSVSLYLTNNSVTAQYLANRMLEAAREDLQLQCEINYIGLELEAGDIVTVTNSNYGWNAKLFRILKVIEKFGDNGSVTASLSLSEYNPAVYDDKNVTQFTPAPNSGLPSPTTFGLVPSPTIINSQPSITNPSFSVRVRTSSAGITQYAEIWYSPYQFPTDTQLIFAGTTAVQPDGNPYVINTLMPDATVSDIPAGDWYFFVRMVNNLAKSNYSLASSVFKWRPTTFQYTERYVVVAYADDINGGGFDLDPRGHSYYGLLNQDTTTPSTNPADYNWYLANPVFSTNKFLIYNNRTGRKFSFATDNCAYAAGTASFVPTTTSKYDPSTWSGLQDDINYIDLDARTGQLITTGTTTTGTGEVSIVNTTDGRVVAALQQFLDFGGAPTFTGSAATLTIDIYGRVVGFTSIDEFFMTISQFVATSGQTVFSVTRDASYIVGQCLVFENGILLSESDYTDASGSVTLAVGATLDANITIISMRAISSGLYYNNTHVQVKSVASNVVTWNNINMPYNAINIGDLITFSNTGTPTAYTVTGVNYSTAEITFSGAVTASAGQSIYQKRTASSSYPVFTRYSAAVVNDTSYTPSLWNFDNGFELPFLNGCVIPDQDYDISGNSYISVPNIMTGDLDIIQFTGNNVTTPTGNYVNMVRYTVIGQPGYSFSSIDGAFNLYANGALLVNGVDYTSTTGSYTLTVTPTNNTTVLQQQTFARYGAA